jgi:hypothetical protein
MGEVTHKVHIRIAVKTVLKVFNVDVDYRFGIAVIASGTV